MLVRSLTSILALSLSATAFARSTSDNDPYIAWARHAFENASAPKASELAAGKVWTCTVAEAQKYLFYYEAVPTFQFEIKGKKVRNTLLLQNQREDYARRYAFGYNKETLVRDFPIGLQVSIGANHANPEVKVPTQFHDSLRFYQGYLILQRSMPEKDRAKFEDTTNEHRKLTGLAPSIFELEDAIKDGSGDAGKSFEYFVCENDATASYGGTDLPPAPVMPPNIVADEDGKLHICPQNMTPDRNRVATIEVSKDLSTTVGEGWLEKVDHLRRGLKNQSVRFRASEIHSWNIMNINVGLQVDNRAYKVLGYKDDYSCK